VPHSAVRCILNKSYQDKKASQLIRWFERDPFFDTFVAVFAQLEQGIFSIIVL
jgi:hypothetical protein